MCSDFSTGTPKWSKAIVKLPQNLWLCLGTIDCTLAGRGEWTTRDYGR